MSALFMTVEGVVGTEPRRGAWNGTPVLSFRMVAKERRYDSLSQGWVDVHSSWVSVSCFRNLARNAAASVKKGDRLIVHGKVKVKDYVTDAGQQRTTIDVEATAIGHDLKFGTARFQPAVSQDSNDDRLREQADLLVRQLADLPEESVEQLLAQRAALVEDDPDADDELVDALDPATGELLDPDDEEHIDDLEDDEEERDRRGAAPGLAGSGRR